MEHTPIESRFPINLSNRARSNAANSPFIFPFICSMFPVFPDKVLKLINSMLAVNPQMLLNTIDGKFANPDNCMVFPQNKPVASMFLNCDLSFDMIFPRIVVNEPICPDNVLKVDAPVDTIVGNVEVPVIDKVLPNILPPTDKLLIRFILTPLIEVELIKFALL